MLLPEELRRTDFPRAIRGYSTSEVDDYIDFLIEKYTALDRANDELERKLALTTKILDEYRGKEDELRRMKKEAQRISATMIANTEAKCGRMMNEAEIYSKRVLAELREKSDEKKRIINGMSEAVNDFKDQLFRMYSEHISLIENVAALADKTADSVIDGAFPEDRASEYAATEAEEFDLTPVGAAISFAVESDDGGSLGEFIPDSEAYAAGLRAQDILLGNADGGDTGSDSSLTDEFNRMFEG